MSLDPRVCYRAVLARDARFDGLFFTGVSTTGVYCRPICRARTPGADRCRFFRFAVEAEREGYRACFRCRPELAPGASSEDALSRLVGAAVTRIEAGALSEGGLEALAEELGVTSRHLRRAVQRELGVAPIVLAQSRRLALAKHLVQDSLLPLTQVAFASGFASVRRFNAAFREHYGRPPSSLRRQREGDPRLEAVSVRLDYRPPFDWAATLAFLGPRAIPGVEHVDGASYRRSVALGHHRGWLEVRADPEAPRLHARVSLSLAPVLMDVVARLRRMLDLDARPQVIAAHLARDRRLSRSLARRPGLRLPGSFDGFATCVRAILGQQVTVAAATTLAGRLASRFGEPCATPFPEVQRIAPSAQALAAARTASIAGLGVIRSRAEAIRALARAVDRAHLRLESSADPAATVRALQELPGIGPWTAEYVGLRVLAWPDAFPAGDLILRRALGDVSTAAAERISESWRPWRAYAALHLWSSYGGE